MKSKLFPILSVFMLVVTSVFSLAAESPKSLLEQATQEVAQPQNIIEADQQLSGVISLEDEYGKKARSSYMATSLRLQQLTHVGSATIGGTNRYQFESFGATVRPSLALSIFTREYALTNFTIQYGVQLEGGFTSQDTKMSTITGVEIDGRLQYFDLSVKPTLQFPWQSFARMSTQFFGEFGSAQLAMASRSSSARFNRNAQFFGYGLALAYDMSKQWEIELAYSERRSLTDQTDWSLSSANTQLGVQYQW